MNQKQKETIKGLVCLVAIIVVVVVLLGESAHKAAERRAMTEAQRSELAEQKAREKAAYEAGYFYGTEAGKAVRDRGEALPRITLKRRWARWRWETLPESEQLQPYSSWEFGYTHGVNMGFHSGR